MGIRHSLLRMDGRLLLRGLRNALNVALVGLVCFLLLDLMCPVPGPKAYSPEVLARDGSLLRSYLTPDQKWRMSTRLDEVPPELPQALVAKEDRWFWWHPGVNPVSVVRAAAGNALSGERGSGASTITMQLARMLEPKPRTVWGKVVEAFRALQLEWHHSKAEILEMYMSHLPYGGNIEGVKAASYLYFQRPPGQLSLAQSTLLTVIPNRPNSLRPDLHGPAALAARNRWLDRFDDEGIFERHMIDDAVNEPMPNARYTLPVRAPQFCEWVRSRAGTRAVRTTLDPRLQALTQELLANHVRRVKPMGIRNGAVLVVDNRTMEVLAYCGSADFEDKAAQGEVDAIHAVRSPGSALKPFIYALAFDRGLITPQSSLLDIPGEFTDFTPVNYDRDYRGEVTAAEALRHSLNLPAVRLLHQVGMAPFLRLLDRAGFATVMRQRSELGLSLALGGCGVTMEELVRAYAALGHGGELLPLRWRVDAPVGEATGRICSPEAAYMVTDILSGIQRPDLPAQYLGRSKLPRVAWKTGTSFGRRDAWSIGYNPRYTVGVWMGNMDGKAVLEMSGSRTAVPLLLEVFNGLDYDASKQWFPVPGGLVRRKVCAETGLPLGTHCQQEAMDWAIPGRSPERVCDRDREVYTNLEGTVQYCKACLPIDGYTRRIYPVLPPSLVLWKIRTQQGILRPPPHYAACTAIYHDQGPRVHSPVGGQTYYVEDGQELLLQAEPSPDVNTHYWFAEDEFLGAVPAGEKFFYAPRSGQIHLRCMDDKGRVTQTTMMVEMI